ncbi:MAG TPA: PfkB family carbohydrate kinase [Chloroflexota bacterium]|nr:PfkB family carbohydrate kinase [Chloroflexota bacterium]
MSRSHTRLSRSLGCGVPQASCRASRERQSNLVGSYQTASPDVGARAGVVCAGIVVADMFVPALNQMPGPGDLVTTADLLVSAGGCASNTARCPAGLGYESAVIGRVGSDPFWEHALDVTAVKGTGAGGRIEVQDVLRAAGIAKD